MNDYESVEQLVLGEREARGRGLHDAMVKCYWPDATVTTSWISGSATDYINAGHGRNLRPEASANERIVGLNCAPIIHLNNSRAYVELPVEANHWITVNGENAVWTSYMKLLYRCEKRDGEWRISDLTSIFNNDKLAPVVPGTDLHINPDDLKGLRSAYLWMSYIRKSDGGSVSQDLPGTDQPEKIDKIYQYDEEWINEGSK